MLAFLITDGVDEQDQKGRAGQLPIVLPSDAGVSDKTVPEVQVTTS